MKINVAVSIGRGSDDRVRICLTDESSGVEFVEVSMSLEDFGAAVTNKYVTKVPAKLRHLEYIGMVSEHKTELVPFDTFKHDPKDVQARQTLTDFEAELNKVQDVPGATPWRGRLDDLKNHHHHVDKNVQRVTFFRFVPAKT